MADISACVNGSCPKRLSCYRFRCRWSEYWQSFADFSPDPLTGACMSFIPLDPLGRQDVCSESESEARAVKR